MIQCLLLAPLIDPCYEGDSQGVYFPRSARSGHTEIGGRIVHEPYTGRRSNDRFFVPLRVYFEPNSEF